MNEFLIKDLAKQIRVAIELEKIPYKETMQEITREILSQALEENGNSITQASISIGVKRTCFHGMLVAAGLRKRVPKEPLPLAKPDSSCIIKDYELK